MKLVTSSLQESVRVPQFYHQYFQAACKLCVYKVGQQRSLKYLDLKSVAFKIALYYGQFGTKVQRNHVNLSLYFIGLMYCKHQHHAEQKYEAKKTAVGAWFINYNIKHLSKCTDAKVEEA